MAGKLYIIDGHALIFKMYYAFLRRPMINSKGADMSILYGFTKYVLELEEREKPTHIAVSFDPPGGTFRNKMYPEYKANRAETPQLVIDALEPLMELCKALNIRTLMIPGYEADDVIGTVAKRLAGQDLQVYMVTPDKDYGQLIDEHIFQLKPGKGGGADELMDKAAVCEKFGIQDPSQVIEMLTLCGDTADNVPGVKGVGEVGAAKLISKYGTVENIYAHLDELSPRQKAMFEEAAAHIGLSHDLVTIKTDVPLEVDLDSLACDNAYGTLAADLFEKYEFASLKRYLGDVKPTQSASKQLEIKQVDANQICTAAKRAGRIALVCDSDGSCIFAPITRITAAVQDGGQMLCAEGLPEDFASALKDKGIAKCGFDMKLLLDRLSLEGTELEGKLEDVELMHYLIDPEKSHKCDILSASYLGVDINEDSSPASLFEQGGGNRWKEAAATFLLAGALRSDMESHGVSVLYDQIEEPLSRVLSKMELHGVKVDLDSLKEFASGLRQELSALESRIREMADEPGLNISSPKQVGDLLFGKLALDPKAKKNAGGSFTTDEATLLAIADRHPIINEILEYRAVKKLLSTYIEPFPAYISPRTGRVHTTFNQALTATGRLSSSNPNLQNIPIRTERGKEIRKAFVPGSPDGLILSADYSQIELRIMAHLCGDEHLVAAFRQGLDVHKATAAKIFGVPVEEVTREQRGRAKTANFGIMYGISTFGLAQRLNLPRKEAKELIDGYFEAFPAIRSFIEGNIAFAREHGYVETMFGRRRYLPDINSKNATVRSLAERNAVNAPIQGSAADIIKIAMTGVQRRIEEAGLRSLMVLQIHDELLFDTFPDEVEELKQLVVSEMENVISLKVPLTAECNYGKNWLEAH
ncbi:MAG: DNA polymerase I [Bacteroidales bacterium]|nr:DNA polymerase I [Bacteroidales bacterium]